MTEYPILAIDYGKKHFGLAISDSKGIIASPLEVLSVTEHHGRTEIIQEILEICKEYRIKTILLGYPQAFIEKHKTTQKHVSQFEYKLKESVDIPIILYDESFSTTSAENMLISSGQNTKGFRNKIDKIAATVFLQEFLNSKN
jgi:putative holliday junction resolvase